MTTTMTEIQEGSGPENYSFEARKNSPWFNLKLSDFSSDFTDESIYPKTLLEFVTPCAASNIYLTLHYDLFHDQYLTRIS